MNWQSFTTIIINILIIAAFVFIVKKKNFLTFFSQGRWWVTFFAIGIITLMDELTSIYYAPFEAYRFIGSKAVIYIALTSIFIRFLSTRFTEISEILEVNKIKGGGVYSFSYLVLGSSVSFIAISSILVDYILTATISTVSAVENGTSFLGFGPELKFFIKIIVIWLIAGLNVLGIKENAKFTFLIFIFATFILLNLLIGSFFSLDLTSLSKIQEGFSFFISDFSSTGIFGAYSNVIIGVGSCILAYSGVESVLQTASLVKSWHDIRKAYIFLALTVGIVTPLIALFGLTANVDLSKHETDLIPILAATVNGHLFGIVVAALASITLIMAVNTAMIASSELIENIAERYNYTWLIKINKRQSFYRIHLINALFYSIILIITSGSQPMLAEMYAVGLVASFCINIGSLLIYRYFKGTKEISYHTSRTGTLILFLILLSIFIYLAYHRPFGTLLWFIMASLILIGGLRISKFRSPAIPSIRATQTAMDIIFSIIEMESNEVHIYFRRPKEFESEETQKNSIFISFYTPRIEQPESDNPKHIWILIPPRLTLFDMIKGILSSISYDVPPEKKLHIHFGWPQASWFDRISSVFKVHSIIKLPQKFPQYTFHIDYIESRLRT